jgi:hypothetical protein
MRRLPFELIQAVDDAARVVLDGRTRVPRWPEQFEAVAPRGVSKLSAARSRRSRPPITQPVSSKSNAVHLSPDVVHFSSSRRGILLSSKALSCAFLKAEYSYVAGIASKRISAVLRRQRSLLR